VLAGDLKWTFGTAHHRAQFFSALNENADVPWQFAFPD
jgi:hypothetical protein